MKKKNGQSLVELLLVMGMMAIVLPALLTGFVATRSGKPQQIQKVNALALMKETQEAVRSIRNRGWANIASNGTYHPVLSGSIWTFVNGSDVINNLTRSVDISDVSRNASGAIVTSGGTVDPSTKKVVITISWTLPYVSQINTSMYFTRYQGNVLYTQTTSAQFSTDTHANTQVQDPVSGDGEVVLSNNNKAKWCAPSFSTATIDLPDGPPVAVAARSGASSSTPNDVLVATSPLTSNSIKMAHVTITADSDPPAATLRGKFTLDAAQYSAPGLVPSGIGIDNNFKTNDIKYYTSSSGKLYALLATNLPDKEVIAILVNDNDDASNSEFQDPTNKIYKYWTYFNTKIYGTAFNNPTNNAADTGGDGNGYQTNPTSAYTYDGSFATDTNSGSNTGTSCVGADKDRHRFYDYNLSIPGGATINGIEVDLVGKVDNITGTPKICVQLSWDGGTTWTAAKTSANLTTSNATYVLGGAADTWGRTWSDTNFSNANFRVRVIDVASNISRDFSLDWPGVKVYYNGIASGPNDQAPFGYGAKALTILGNTAYTASGGYLYTFDLTNIDSKSSSSGFDEIGCRIELYGYDCNPGSGTDRKYSAGEVGSSWSDTTGPAHNDCSDGGNIELFADNDLAAVQVGGNNYVYAAVGAGTDKELDIVNTTNVPDSASNPSIANVSCGRTAGGNAGWQTVGSIDFNSIANTEEAANSVYAKSDGTRAYISSNGGIDANNDGTPDSKQFYIVNTSTKSNPVFLSGTSNGGPTSGFYYGAAVTPTPNGPIFHNDKMYPRRSLTVLDGGRAIVVGKDIPTPTPKPLTPTPTPGAYSTYEYQVLNLETEAAPAFCGAVDFDQGFNDLTSVSEADSDTFVYMVADTNVNELKIIQGGADHGVYVDSGTVESATFDPGFSTSYNRFFSTLTLPSGTSVQYQFAVADPVNGSCNGVSFNYVGPDGTNGTKYTTDNGQVWAGTNGTYANPGRCFRWKAWLTGSAPSYNSTPVINDFSVNYTP